MKSWYPIACATGVLYQVAGVWSARNITVDDNSPLIRYQGKWDRSGQNTFSFGGSHASSIDTSIASATFTFTGIGVYFMSPLWSIPIAVTLTLDGRPPDVVDLQTTLILPTGWESETSAARWGISGLENATHSLVVTYGRPLNATRTTVPFTVVDAFVYTVEDESSSSTSSSTTSSTTTSTSTSSPSNSNASSSSSTPLIAGLLGALAGVGLISGLAFFILWRRKRQRNASLSVSPINDNDTGPLGAFDPYSYSSIPPTEPFCASTSEAHRSTKASEVPTFPSSKRPPVSPPLVTGSTPYDGTSSLTSAVLISASTNPYSSGSVGSAMQTNPLAAGAFSPRDSAPPPPYDQQ